VLIPKGGKKRKKKVLVRENEAVEMQKLREGDKVERGSGYWGTKVHRKAFKSIPLPKVEKTRTRNEVVPNQRPSKAKPGGRGSSQL